MAKKQATIHKADHYEMAIYHGLRKMLEVMAPGWRVEEAAFSGGVFTFTVYQPDGVRISVAEAAEF